MEASEVRYRRLFETAQDSILILNGDSGEIVDANPFVIHLLGYSLAELTGKQLWEIGLFRDAEANKAAFHQLQTDGYIRYENLPLQTKGGKGVDVEFVSNTYTVGNRNIIQCNIRDITERVRISRALEASEIRYRRLFEAAQDAILILDGDSGTIIDANPFMIDLLGYSLAELSGKQLWQIGLFRDVEENKAAFERLQKTGYSRYEGLPLETKNGRRVEVEFVSNAYKVVSRNIIQCNVRDITERVRISRALEASEARYRRLFETAQDAILILDGSSGKVIDANPFVIDLLGYSLDELMGRELWEIGLFRDIDESKAAFEQLKRNGFIRYEDLPLLSKGGKRAEVEFISNAYEVDGRPIIQCNIRDISDRKAAERAAREGAERFHFLAESMPQKIFTTTPAGVVNYFNQQWNAFAGLSSEEGNEIGDWKWTAFLHPEDVTETVRNWQHSLDTGEPFEMQHRFRRADGTYRWHLSRACAMRDSNQHITMWISSNTDIDDQKGTEADLSLLYERAESLNRAKDEFIATISHELRTPMTSILGWTSLLATDSLDESSRREGIETIHRSAKLQAQLIDDVLDVSRMVTGKMRLLIEPVDLESLLREGLTAIIPAAEAKRLQIKIDFQPGLPSLDGDPIRLQQVFWNLLSNAVKFTPAGGRIEARLFARDSDVVIEVEDSGAGIRSDFLPRAFDRFAQEEGSIIRQYGGMGIGLAIVKQLVELHGGIVSVASEGEGRGAIFTVSIPVQVRITELSQPIEAEGRRTKTVTGDIPSIAGVRVLVVDDEPDSRRTIGAILEHYGAVVTSASSAAEGFAFAERESFDALLCDIAMPEEDGYSLIRRIRSRVDDQSRIPAVALTAYHRPSERDIALAEGFNEYLKKPFEPSELIALVATAAGRNSRVGDSE